MNTNVYLVTCYMSDLTFLVGWCRSNLNSHCTNRECVPIEFVSALVVQARGVTVLHKTRGMILDTFRQPFKAMIEAIWSPKLVYLIQFRKRQTMFINTSYLAPL